MIEQPAARSRKTTDNHARAYCLSIHAGYLCRHSGACCTAGWHIPVEATVAAALRARFDRPGQAVLFRTPADPHDPPVLATADDGACIFFDAAHGRRCRVHGNLGESKLPSACRQFPRVTLTDPRGTWITLSHFCPTAAGLLLAPAPLRIVAAPEPLALSGAAEGLDATDALPPLLRPGMLMDLEGYTAWEQAGVELLGSAGPDAGAALAALQEAGRTIRGWSPGRGTLRDLVTRTMGAMTCSPVEDDPAADARRYALALASVPPSLLPAEVGTAGETHGRDVSIICRDFDAVIRRYLASKLFASWWAYLGLDLVGVIEAIQIHGAVLRSRIARRLRLHDTPGEIVLEAIRDSDLLMAHLSDSRTLARLIAANLQHTG
jgi:Fe-S-cluster containining protein